MTTATTVATSQREPKLTGQTLVLIGGSAGIGLETARLACAEGADVILAARNPDRLQAAADEVGARRPPPSTAPIRPRSPGSPPPCPGPSTTCWSPARPVVHARPSSRPDASHPRRHLGTRLRRHRRTKDLGATALATIRQPGRLDLLAEPGVDHPLLDNGAFADAVRDLYHDGVDAGLELVGTPTLGDTLAAAKVRGTVCFVGMLSSQWIIHDFYPIAYIHRAVRLTAYAGEADDFASGAAMVPRPDR